MNLKTWSAVAATLVLLGVIVLLINEPQITNYYIIHVYGPSLERDLGFKTVTGPHRGFPDEQIFYIDAVDPTGIFAQSGVRSGYIPYGYKHGFAAGFFGQLQNNRGHATELRFLEVLPTGATLEHKKKINVPQ